MARKKNSFSLGVIFIFGLLIAGGSYLYTSELFEREVPTLSIKNSGYWNLKKPLDLVIKDNSGIVSYKVSILNDDGKEELLNEKLEIPEKTIKLKLKAPRTIRSLKTDSLTVVVEAKDMSKWNFFAGNKTVKKFKFIVDKKRPELTIINNSYKISKGGSALVIFKAKDDNLDKIYIQTNYNKVFKVQPFYKDGYYISLLAWPIVERNFKATIVVEDLAGNISKSYIPLYLKMKEYRVSNIKISDKFLKGKIADLAEEFDETQGVDDSIEQFKIINEDVRAKNEKLIHEITSKLSDEMISDFKIKKMYPLKNAQVVARFGDHRKYYYNGKYISESYHLGLDLASNSLASIKPHNRGVVVFSDYNGLYGNMPIIDHGLGLYTLYGHCSSVSVQSGDEVVAKESIANTGKTGYAMGDHLHFGVLVQGIEVRPQEWMDKRWIKLNITNIIKEAKKTIDRI